MLSCQCRNNLSEDSLQYSLVLITYMASYIVGEDQGNME